MALYDCRCFYDYDKELLLAALNEFKRSKWPWLTMEAEKYKETIKRVEELSGYIEKTPVCGRKQQDSQNRGKRSPRYPE